MANYTYIHVHSHTYNSINDSHPIRKYSGDDGHDSGEDVVSDGDYDCFDEVVGNLASDWSADSVGAFPLADGGADRPRHLFRSHASDMIIKKQRPRFRLR